MNTSIAHAGIPCRDLPISSKADILSKQKHAKYVYTFGNGKADGDRSMKILLGGKGAGLAEMSALGLPVPPGFTITTQVCTWFTNNVGEYPPNLDVQVTESIAAIEKITATRFGDPLRPLLLSVRSGSRVSMPGMMDTVLNLGLNDRTVQGLASDSEDPRFAYDSYRRFIQMFADVVMGVPHHHFEHILDQHKRARSFHLDTDLSAQDWQQIISQYKIKIHSEAGHDFPQDPRTQLWHSIAAVFRSWSNARAVTYRKLQNIPNDWGTAVNVQAMVFGNMGESSATGVAFTRNPATGDNALYGEYLVNAQGEDVVAGIRTPQQITIAGKVANRSNLPAMEEVMPSMFHELNAIRHTLEEHYSDMQDIEFTIQRGKLYILQTRAGKRTARAALKIACEMVEEGLITEDEAVMRVDPSSLNQLLHPRIDPTAERQVLAEGLAASPGAASGHIVFSADEAERLAQSGEKAILCRTETSPEDIHGMNAAVGIVTSRGGMTSHAAVVARGMGRACVAGASNVNIDYNANIMEVGGKILQEGDIVTIDGGSGEVMLGEVPTIEPELSGDFSRLMGWADKRRKLGVLVNADTPEDCRKALEFGAEGIGLCRTEHMFFEGVRIVAMREMILATNVAERRKALRKVLPMQRDDFAEIFRIMKGRPVTIRLLDPPLHEFLPHTEAEMHVVSAAAGLSLDYVREQVIRLRETNPMLGHRGCRVGITYPEVYEMQTRAILEAGVIIGRETGVNVEVEIMVPFVGVEAELKIVKECIDKVAKEVLVNGEKVHYVVGTMIELPRAALNAGKIAKQAHFFSFGTNDLTQMTFGLSRDDAGSFLPTYEKRGIIEADPFVHLDEEGVGELMQLAVERGRKTRADLKVCVCGEHGGDAKSVIFCHKLGLDCVSCSPYRVPIARLAAAHAALSSGL
uniref:Pyruvate, phosphate dikinase n=1 Tax=Eucheuma denticulatum TaxID=305493 RepID=A0A097IU15_9FLOR|nr:pyruvate orthophosphate dikinase [Eucheuma denticulatum]|eukprot:GFKZ01006276.1.p1 GENE.GFKZ01006276.1~~GFKZ01006276.1.p1  ORF type:complete len:916 (-),score=138.09 GFKZ01006276.1:312-3059(-)